MQRVRAVALTVAGNPYLSAGGAAGLFLITAVVLIAAMGDPSAGTPVIRISLAKTVAAAAPAGWREALTSEGAGEAPMAIGAFELSEAAIGGEPSPSGGEAVITLPGAHADTAPGLIGGALPPAPIAGLTAPGSNGPLPIIAADGRRPSEAYARPFSGNGKPKVAIIVGGLGLNAQTTRRAIDTLPPEVTLSFVPYSEGLQGWIDLARAAGHEVLLEAPMEPVDYPANDPGPYTLLAQSRPNETTGKLEWLLSRATGYFGLTNYLGSRFVTSADAMGVFSGVLRARGLAFIDDGSAARQRASFGAGLPRASAERIIDGDLTAESITTQLSGLESSAMNKGQALGSAFAYPLTLDAVRAWAAGLPNRGLQLAPASAVMQK